MQQAVLLDLFRANVEPLEQASLPPIQTRGSTRTTHSSAMGALSVSGKAVSQQQRILALYQALGELTDQQVADLLCVSRSSVIPRRHALMRLGLVEEKGFRKNERTGISNTTFGVTAAG